MSKFLFTIFITLFFLLIQKNISAEDAPTGTPILDISPLVISATGTAKITTTFPDPKASQYRIRVYPLGGDHLVWMYPIKCSPVQQLCNEIPIDSDGHANNIKWLSKDQLSFDLQGNQLPVKGTYFVSVQISDPFRSGEFTKTFIVESATSTLNMELNPSSMAENLTKNGTINIKLVDGRPGRYKLYIPGVAAYGYNQEFDCSGPGCNYSFKLGSTGLGAGTYLFTGENINDSKITGSKIFTVSPSTGTGAGGCKPGDANCTTAGGKTCTANGKPGIDTALGCIPTEPTALIQGLLKFSVGIGGGIALLLMIYGAFQMITSAGNPDNVKKGADQFRDAIIGLLFIIFSVMLLQIIGVDILSIPGFNR